MSCYKDLIGQTFGRLTVIAQTERHGGPVLWHCVCECGGYKIVKTNKLTGGDVSSCGCLRRENGIKYGRINGKMTALDLVGQRFGRLCVDSRHGSRNKKALWSCQCDCGNKGIIVTSGDLRNGHTKSCGCLQKESMSKTGKSNTTHGLSNTSAYRDIRYLTADILNVGWSEKMEKGLRKLQPVCVVCGSNRRMTTDHVLPLSKGHGLSPGNAVRMCNRCNSYKNNRDLSELPPAMRTKILTAAKQFEEYWNSL